MLGSSAVFADTVFVPLADAVVGVCRAGVSNRTGVALGFGTDETSRCGIERAAPVPRKPDDTADEG